MKKRDKKPLKTPAIRFLDQHKFDYEVFQCEGEIEGTADFMANFLGVSAHKVIKSIVFMDDKYHGYMVLQHGDQTIDTKILKKLFEVKNVRPAPYEYAHKWTGYEFGGTSPFGIKANIPIYAEKTIFELDELYINGGMRGVNVLIKPDILTAIGVIPAEVTK